MRPSAKLPVRAAALLAAAVASALGAQAPGRRALTADDVYRVREVSDPQLSPDGDWVAYAVSTPDSAEDRSDSDVWMARWDGSRAVRLTWSTQSEHTPRWSPDGRYLAFLSGREDDEGSDQLWLLDRTGGEAERITSFPGGVVDYVWAPGGRSLALIVADPDPDSAASHPDSAKRRTPRPIVIDRFQFKRDVDGYLGPRRQHLYRFDLDGRAATLLTPGQSDEALPAWSPDGRSIAFVTKRGPDVDRTNNWDLYVVSAAPCPRGAGERGAGECEPRQLTTFEGPDGDPDYGSRPAWSPDGRSIAYLQGGPQKLIYYAVQKLAVVPAAGGEPRVLTAELDRNAFQPQWSADGRSILFVLEDDRNSHLARVPAGGGKVERLLAGRRVVSAFTTGRGGRTVALSSSPDLPPELFALGSATDRRAGKGAAPRPLTRHNAEWLAGVRLAAVEEIEFPSADGTRIGGFLVLPPDYQPGRKYPAVLRIHGGPVWQFGNEFELSWQLLAANGYVVIAANPRGSSGRGEAFSSAIYADWGNKDAQDVLAAVDYAVKRGVADPDRLGVGGWSYGGILTNYTIAQDTRFKAAVSGAGIANVLAGYGTDQYVREYEAELGTPWENTDLWIKLSSPFLHADRIVTPTLFICGEKDFNVPLLNSEQMYQALRSLGRETQLVIYPDQYHSITKPSYERDRLMRYVAWYDKYLKPGTVGRAGRR
jgi:dipeptidyl aminopeptidase/acylaminoacyl peptidase